ncbi:MAG: veratrol--corrinoid protein metyltransferase [Oscillospiraceae bacterium]|jgi:hypothetical protein|nr:veratrol--corrinoid protein metyltransferase [Oscillospiraceae bacterium]
MPTLSDKENYLRMMRGEVPERVPQYNYFKVGADEPATMIIEPAIINPHRVNAGGHDCWGVNWVPTAETAGGLIPEPNNFILRDVTKWREVIKAPDTSGIDWERAADADLKRMGINRGLTACAFAPHFGYFQTFVSFMGFENAMMAMAEEPDSVHELLGYVADFYQTVIEGYIDVMKPDVLTHMDDTAAWAAPFISPAMYREFLLPHHKRYSDLGRERGLPQTMHNCGKSECFADIFTELGITLWEPAQTSNDLAKVKAEKNIFLAGGWDARGRLLEPDVTEEEIRQSARDSIDKLAPGGGYAWFGGFLGAAGDAESARRNAILMDEVTRYGAEFYKH